TVKMQRSIRERVNTTLSHVLSAVDRSAGVPLHTQIAMAIRDAIRNGTLAPGTLLPSTRELTQEARGSRNTIVAAYETLASQGLIVSEVGSGTRVSGRLSVVHVSDSAWRKVVRESRYPQRIAHFADSDGNILYLSTRV